MATQLEATPEQLLERALRLPIQQRIELAEALFDSVDEEDPAALEAAWGEEIQQRIEEIRNGTVETIPADEVMAEMRARFG
jgi:putative addiction module component (TIGR02574 family)